jgi:flavin reductase (DIM6/NTAB) family NADH-FMN oxidoreductase RutF
VNTQTLRHTLGAFATGVTVVTTGRGPTGNPPHGMTANAFTSVSLDPPLVLVCVDRDAVLHESLKKSGTFGISVLTSGQEDIARHFADTLRPLGDAQFASVDWTPGPRTGAPMICGALARFECEVWRTYDGGDHTIFLGRLLTAEREPYEDALLFLHGRFEHLDPAEDGVTA